MDTSGPTGDRPYEVIGFEDFTEAMNDRSLPARGRIVMTPADPRTGDRGSSWAVCVGRSDADVARGLAGAMQATGLGHEPPDVQALLHRAMADMLAGSSRDRGWQDQHGGRTIVKLRVTYTPGSWFDWSTQLTYWRTTPDGASFIRAACGSGNRAVEALDAVRGELDERHPDIDIPPATTREGAEVLTASQRRRKLSVHWWRLPEPRA